LSPTTDFELPEDFDLGEHFDHRTLTRAMEMQPQRVLLSMEVRGPRLLTRMQGVGPITFNQSTEMVVDRRLGLRVVGKCTCPVGNNCQHIAAALMAFEARQIRLQKGLPDILPGPSVQLQPVYSAPAEEPVVMNLGQLTLQPVLRLATCIDVASEALLHQRYGSAASRGITVRQASAQVLLRYQPDSGAPVDFHFPSGHSTTALAEVADPQRPGKRVMAHFQRQAAAESAALRLLFNDLNFRPWSLSAGLAMSRLTRTGGPRSSTVAPTTNAPAGLEGSPLILVPQRRDQWPQLLANQIPELEAQGWEIEVMREFPFELHRPDDWAVSVREEAGSDWFNVGLKVSVDGQPVDLVPLLINLVQTGWLKLDATVREGEGSSEKPNEVLLPWPSSEPAAPGEMPKMRLLRLPVSRIAPLMDWLRVVFRGGDKGGLRLSRFDLGTLEALAHDAKVTAPPSFTELIAQVKLLGSGSTLPAVDVSPGVHATLRHYQLDGLAWMDFLRRARLGGVLADDMGLGKTLQALALLQGELDAGRLDRPALVVVPTSLLSNWQAEAQRFTPGLKVLVLHGAQRARHFKRIASANLVITSYPLAVRDAHVLRAQDWHYVMLDEAQRIKNSRSQATLAVKGLHARHRLCLSGTPLENHLGELWSLMDFVCPGLLGSEAQFREHYRNRIEKRHDTLQAEHLARRVRPFILRRTKQQVAQELPEKTETHLRVELSGAQRDLYETVRATMDRKLRDAIAQQGLARSQIMVLDALLKLRQVCCDPRLLKVGDDAAAPSKTAPSAKMELLRDLLPTLIEDGRRVLLFSQFTEMLALIETEVTKLKLPYLKLTGETQDRASVVEEFQQGNTPLFLISLKAGGVGLNLTAADTVILYDPWWNPAVEQQAIDRAYRIGQDKPVFVYKLLASGTVEDKMLELQERKAGLADLLLSGVASDAALNAQDFDELFKPLGGDAEPLEPGEVFEVDDVPEESEVEESDESDESDEFDESDNADESAPKPEV
jgi:ERCC4-related helicase